MLEAKELTGTGSASTFGIMRQTIASSPGVSATEISANGTLAKTSSFEIGYSGSSIGTDTASPISPAYLSSSVSTNYGDTGFYWDGTQFRLSPVVRAPASYAVGAKIDTRLLRHRK